MAKMSMSYGLSIFWFVGAGDASFKVGKHGAFIESVPTGFEMTLK